MGRAHKLGRVALQKIDEETKAIAEAIGKMARNDDHIQTQRQRGCHPKYQQQKLDGIRCLIVEHAPSKNVSQELASFVREGCEETKGNEDRFF